ncbi:MAG: ATP-binding protein, partial [Actinomycetota bacterium]|nr:ATP-binding protein [Actinomycetota bacterium]
MAVSGLKTRKPTGRVPWPCILLEGEEKAGKSWALAQFSTSDRIGALYWIDLNEGAGDEYGAIPGANYQLIQHDGSYAQVLAAVQAVKAEARRAADAGEPPVVLGIDTGSAIWEGLKDWASARAAKSARNRELLERDPNAEIVISQNLWNDAGARWRKLQTELLTFPGIVVVTARGKEVTEVDANGRPIEGQKTWSVQTHREFPYAATVWVRLRRGRRPVIVGARSVHVGIKPNDDPAKEVTDPKANGRLLEWLVFDALKCDPGTAHVRDLVSFHGGGLLEHERTEEAGTGRTSQRSEPDVADLVARIQDAEDDDDLREVWAAANRSALLQVDVPTPSGSYTVGELIQARHEEFLEASLKAHPAGRRKAEATSMPPAPTTPAAVVEAA